MRVDSAVTSGRLSAYLYVFERAHARGGAVVSSADIAAVTGGDSSQVRHDLSRVVGRAGQLGVGYRPWVMIPRLRAQLASGAGAGAGVVLVAAEQARRNDGNGRLPSALMGGGGELEALVRIAADAVDQIDELIGAGEPGALGGEIR